MARAPNKAYSRLLVAGWTVTGSYEDGIYYVRAERNGVVYYKAENAALGQAMSELMRKAVPR